jgi:hypothetical protein
MRKTIELIVHRLTPLLYSLNANFSRNLRAFIVIARGVVSRSPEQSEGAEAISVGRGFIPRQKRGGI